MVLIDIETYRTRDPRLIEMIRREAVARKPNHNTLKELKATWNRPEDEQARASEALAKTSLDPLRAEILCVGVAIDEVEPRVFTGMWPPNESEQNMLEALAQHLRLNTSAETIWAGHNAEGFDFPIMLNRWRRHGIVPPESFPQPHNGKMRGRVYDTMLRVPSGHGLGMVSLRDACLAYGLPEPKTKLTMPNGDPMGGHMVGIAFEAGEYGLLEDYCLEDMVAVKALYDACTFGGQWGTWEVDEALEAAIGAVRRTPNMGRDQQSTVVLEILAEAGKIPRRFAGMGV